MKKAAPRSRLFAYRDCLLACGIHAVVAAGEPFEVGRRVGGQAHLLEQIARAVLVGVGAVGALELAGRLVSRAEDLALEPEGFAGVNGNHVAVVGLLGRGEDRRAGGGLAGGSVGQLVGEVLVGEDRAAGVLVELGVRGGGIGERHPVLGIEV